MTLAPQHYGRRPSRNDVRKKDGAPLGQHIPITSEKGDAMLEALLNGRSFDSVRVRPIGRIMPRPEPTPVEGHGSSLSANPGTSGGPRKAHMAGSWIR